MRSFYNYQTDIFGIQETFTAIHEASGGAAGTSKCIGDSGDLHKPSPQVLSDRLLDFPLDYPVGTLINYCIAATADETPNKPKYISAYACANWTVNFEARFRVFVGRLDSSPDTGVTVTYFVYGPDSNSSYFDVLASGSNVTALNGYIQIKLNMSIYDYPIIFGVEQLQLGFFFSKTSYFADTNTSVVHTFLCNNGRSQCNVSFQIFVRSCVSTNSE